jgi:hypothetical protein
MSLPASRRRQDRVQALARQRHGVAAADALAALGQPVRAAIPSTRKSVLFTAPEPMSMPTV